MTTWPTPGRWSTLMHHGRQGGYCSGKRQVLRVQCDHFALAPGSIGWRVKVAWATPQWSGTFPPRPAVAPTGSDTLDIPCAGSTGNQSSRRTKALPTLLKWPLVITLPKTNISNVQTIKTFHNGINHTVSRMFFFRKDVFFMLQPPTKLHFLADFW